MEPRCKVIQLKGINIIPIKLINIVLLKRKHKNKNCNEIVLTVKGSSVARLKLKQNTVSYLILTSLSSHYHPRRHLATSHLETCNRIPVDFVFHDHSFCNELLKVTPVTAAWDFSWENNI